MPERPSPPRRTSAHGVFATAAIALAGFMVLLVVLATQLRNDPRAVGLLAAKPRIVVVRHVYETVVHERIIGATGAGATTVSSSSVSAPGSRLPATPVRTRTS